MNQIATLQQKKTKAELWNEIGNTYPVDPNFLWVTQEGEITYPKAMSTWHLFNSLRMIWNHTVAPQYRLIPYKPYKGIDRWPKGMRRRAIRNLFNELMNRPDVNSRMQKELATIEQHVRHYSRKLLPSV